MEHFGGAGHSLEIVKKKEKNGMLIGIDRDEEALQTARTKLSDYQNIKYIHDNHDNIKKILEIEKNISSEEMNIILNNEKQNRELQNIEEEFTLNLAIGINNIINILNPSKICIGGSFIKKEKTLYHMLIAKMNTLTYKFNKPEIILSKLGNDAGIIGATLI